MGRDARKKRKKAMGEGWAHGGRREAGQKKRAGSPYKGRKAESAMR